MKVKPGNQAPLVFLSPGESGGRAQLLCVAQGCLVGYLILGSIVERHSEFVREHNLE